MSANRFVKISDLESIASAPILADEEAAIAANLPAYALYKTPTGELRYKLPNGAEAGLPYVLPFTLN